MHHLAAGARAARRRPGRPHRDPRRQLSGVAPGRLRLPFPRRRRGADLHHAAGRPDRVHPRGQRAAAGSSTATASRRTARRRAPAPRRPDRGRRDHRDRAATSDLTFEALLREGAGPAASSPLDSFRRRAEPDDLASLIYTSGTTGSPKGAMLTHRNLVSNFLACSELFPIGPDDVTLSFLPLSHVFQRLVDYLFLYKGVTIQYLTSIDRRRAPCSRSSHRAGLGAARLRARLPARDGERAQGAGAQAAHLPLGGRDRRALHPTGELKVPARFALQYAAASGSSSARSRSASAGGCGSRSPAAPPCRRRWAASSPRSGSASTKATASPRPRRCCASTTRSSRARERWADRSPASSSGSPTTARSWPRPRPDARLLEQARGDRARRSTRTAGSTPATSATSTPTATSTSPIARRTCIVTSGGKNIAPQPIEQLLTASGVLSQAVVIGDNYPYLTALVVPGSEELPPQLADAHAGASGSATRSCSSASRPPSPRSTASSPSTSASGASG